MIDDFYDTTVTVNEAVRSQSRMGGAKIVYTERISSLNCRIDTKTIREVDEYSKITNKMILRLYCEASSTNLAIETGDQVVYGSRTFDIIGISNPGMQSHHLEIDLEEVV